MDRHGEPSAGQLYSIDNHDCRRPPFLAAIRAAPDDDAPRLIYADWLDENGQPEQAGFIGVQCELYVLQDDRYPR